MAENVDLKSLERKAYRSIFEDGVWDLFIGLIILSLGFSTFLSSILNLNELWFAIIPTLILNIIAFLIFFLGKKFITIPRLGIVKFGQKRKSKQQKLKLFLFIFFLHSGSLHSSNRKLRIITHNASVHLDPDKRSIVVATLAKGTLVSLGSDRKFRTNWNYVYFTSEKTGRTRSGYILDSLVEKLFKVTKNFVIQRESRTANNQKELKTHFRNTYWGMNVAQVARIEGHPDQRDNSGGLDVIQYSKKISNMDCMIGYVFADNKLAKAKYSFMAKYEDKNQYIHNYKKIKDILVKKYGNAEAEKTLWQNKTYKDDRSNWGLALSLGHLELNSLWQDSETEIQLRLHGGNGRVFLVVLYSGLGYMELASKVKAQSHLSIW